MAKIPNGIFGVFLGRAGNLSGYMRNGQNIIRTNRRKTNGKVTPAKQAQQEKIKVCNHFTKAFTGTGFFNKSFPAYGDTGTGYNRATSALMNLAITGSYPDTGISYPLVLISKGPLPRAENASAAVNNEGNILFNWIDNSGTGTAKADDKAIVVAYFPALKQVIYSLNAGIRSDTFAALQTNKMQGYTVETWIGFLSNDEKDTASSVYTGSISL